MAEGKSKTGVVKKRASKREKKDWIAAYIFFAPVTLGLLVFYIWPFIQNIWFSFNEVSKFNVATFCGLANYQKLFLDGEVLKTFGNTLKYVVVTVPVGLFLSILIATLLNSKIKGTSIYRTLYFLPSVTMAAAVAMVWKWIYNEKMGILNSVIRALGGKGIGWLTDPKIALYSVMIVGLWMSVGYNMIILLAGMQGISKSYYEAAQIDGAGRLRTFFQIVFPLLKPTTATLVILYALSLWNDYLLPSLILTDKSLYTIPIATKLFQGTYSNDMDLLMAALVMAIIPVIILYVALQKYIIAGVVAGAVKS